MGHMETFCGVFLHQGEFEAQLDRVNTVIDGAVSAAGEKSLAAVDLENMRKGVMLLCNALKECWRSGILCDSVPVYSLGIVDRPGTGCTPTGCTGEGSDALDEKVEW